VGSADVNTRVKRGMAAEAATFTQLAMFSPADAWQGGEITAMRQRFKVMPNFSIYALVTAPGTFHSILIFDFGAGPGNSVGGRGFQRCVGGIKRVPAKTGVQTRALLMS
jgi:hypothetical protein